MTSRFTVQVVSTDRVQLRRSARFLQSCGYDVRPCSDPAVAVQWIEAAAPAVVLVRDVEGPQAAKILRAARGQKSRPYVAVLQICKELAPHEALDLIQAGWDDLLLEPHKPGELLVRLRSAVRLVEFENRWTAQGNLDLRQALVDRRSWITRLDNRRQACGRTAAPCGYIALVGLDPLTSAAEPHLSAGLQSDSADFLECQQLLAQSSIPGESPARWDRTTLAFYLPQHEESEALAWGEARLEELQEVEAARSLLISWGIVPVYSTGDLDDYLDQAEEALQLARDSGGDIVVSQLDLNSERDEVPEDAAEALFTSTTAEDIMQPFAMLFSAEDTPQQALRLLKQMELPAGVVVDRQGHYLGAVTEGSLNESLHGMPRGRQSGSLRFLRQVVTHPPQFARETSLADLLTYFAETGETSSYAVVTHQRRPIGWIDCQFLATVNAAPLPEDLAPVGAPHAGSRFLIVGNSA